MNQGGIVLKSKKWALCVLVFMLLVFAGCTRATEEGMELFEQKKYDEALELFQKEAESGEEQAEACIESFYLYYT